MSEEPGQSGHALPDPQPPFRARSGHPHADEELAKDMNGRALTVASNLDRYRGTSALLRTRNLWRIWRWPEKRTFLQSCPVR
jgi:hypothetical protein